MHHVTPGDVLWRCDVTMKTYTSRPTTWCKDCSKHGTHEWMRGKASLPRALCHLRFEVSIWMGRPTLGDGLLSSYLATSMDTGHGVDHDICLMIGYDIIFFLKPVRSRQSWRTALTFFVGFFFCLYFNWTSSGSVLGVTIWWYSKLPNPKQVNILLGLFASSCRTVPWKRAVQ